MPHAAVALDAATPLTAVLDLASPGEVLGVWIDIPSPLHPMALRVPASPRWISLLLSGDLASLLARSQWVIVGGESAPRRVAAASLVAVRQLAVETCAGTLLYPLEGVSPEAVLAERRSFRRVAASSVQYLEPG